MIKTPFLFLLLSFFSYTLIAQSVPVSEKRSAAVILYQQAEEAYLKGSVAQAISQAGSAADMAEKDSGLNSKDYGYIASNLAQLYVNTSQPEKGILYAQRAVDAYAHQYGKESLEYAGVCITLGNIYLQQMKLDSAELVLHVPLVIFGQKADTTEEYIGVLNAYGVLYQYKGQPAKAEVSLKDALDRYLKYFPDHYDSHIAILNNLVSVYNVLNEPMKALEMNWRKGALFSSKVSIENPYYSDYLSNYGQLCMGRGLYDSACLVLTRLKE